MYRKSNFIVYLQAYKNSKGCILKRLFLFDVRILYLFQVSDLFIFHGNCQSVDLAERTFLILTWNTGQIISRERRYYRSIVECISWNCEKKQFPSRNNRLVEPCRFSPRFEKFPPPFLSRSFILSWSLPPVPSSNSRWNIVHVIF